MLYYQCDQMLEVKSSPNASKSCPNYSHDSFTKIDLLQNSPKSHHSFWATFVSKFCTKNFQKSPIGSHLNTTCLDQNKTTLDSVVVICFDSIQPLVQERILKIFYREGRGTFKALFKNGPFPTSFSLF